jgi:hypothetical protein
MSRKVLIGFPANMKTSAALAIDTPNAQVFADNSSSAQYVAS